MNVKSNQKYLEYQDDYEALAQQKSPRAMRTSIKDLRIPDKFEEDFEVICKDKLIVLMNDYS